MASSELAILVTLIIIVIVIAVVVGEREGDFAQFGTVFKGYTHDHKYKNKCKY
jgi:hypothetical protein